MPHDSIMSFIMYPLQYTIIQEPQVCLGCHVTKVLGQLQCSFSKTILQIMGNNPCFPQGFFKVKVLLEKKMVILSNIHPDTVALLKSWVI